MRQNPKFHFLMASCLALLPYGMKAYGETPDDFIKIYEVEVRKTDSNFKGFSAERGQKFYQNENKNKKGEMMSCATCHTQDPKASGKTKAGKKIEPMAVSMNNKRFTDKAHVEKWFKRNCKDVYDRECTSQEKGDFVAFMKSL
jgi:hypothetical protein